MNAVKHDFSPEEVMALLDGELSKERATLLAAHLESCSECAEVSANLRGVSKDLAAWDVGTAPHRIKVPLPSLAPNDSAKAGAFSKIGSSRGRYRALVWAAGLGVATLILAALAIPNLLRSRMAANEASAVGSLRTINTSLATYTSTYGHLPPSLRNLGPSLAGVPSEDGADLIDGVLAQGLKSGYFFSYHADGTLGYRVAAIPTRPSETGVRKFLTDQSGVISAEPGGVLDRGESEIVQLKSPVASRAVDLAKVNKNQEAKPIGGGVSSGGRGPGGQPQSGPMIARTASLSIVVKDFSASRNSLDAILARHQGYAASLTVSSPQQSARSLQASLRIPAPQLAAAVSELKALGAVETERQNGEEVTQQHADLVARLKNSAETEQRLQGILQQRTGKMSDVLDVEQEIARVRGEIEQMEAEQKNLEHRVDFATIDLNLSEEYQAQLSSPAPSVSTQLHNALVNGYRNLADTLLALILFFAEYGPVLLFWASLLLVPAWWLWRRHRQAQAVAY